MINDHFNFVYLQENQENQTEFFYLLFKMALNVGIKAYWYVQIFKRKEWRISNFQTNRKLEKVNRHLKPARVQKIHEMDKLKRAKF